MEIMIRLILLLPFAIELIADRKLISSGKPDLGWRWRVYAIMAASGLVNVLDDFHSSTVFDALINQGRYAIISLAPYCFFDIALAVWLHGWRKWWYLGITKAYDRFLSRFNPWFLLVVRAIVCGLLIWWAL